MKRFYIFPLLCFLLLASCDDNTFDLGDVASELQLDSTKPIMVGREASTTEIWFETNSNWSATIEAKDGGMDISPKSGKYGANKVVVSIEENTDYVTRSAVVTITAGDKTQSVTITQSIGTNILEIAEENVVFEAAGGAQEITINNNMEYDLVMADTAVKWLTLPQTKSYNTDKVTLNCAENVSGKTLITMLKLYSTGKDAACVDSVMVVQRAQNILGLSETGFAELPAEGDTVTVAYNVIDGANYEVKNLPSWITALYKRPGTELTSADDTDGDASTDGDVDDNVDGDQIIDPDFTTDPQPVVAEIEFIVGANTTGAARSQIVNIEMTHHEYITDTLGVVCDTITTILSQDIRFAQIMNNVLTSTDNSNTIYTSSISGDGDTVTVDFVANIAYEVVMSDAASEWISEGNSQNQSLELIVADNDTETGLERQDTVTIKSLVDDAYINVIVTQNEKFFMEASTPADSVFHVGAFGEENIMFSVKSNQDPEIECYDEWIKCEVLDNGEFENTYELTVDPMEGSDYSREGYITVSYPGSSIVLIYRVAQDCIVANDSSADASNLDTQLAEKFGFDYASQLKMVKITGTLNSADLDLLAEISTLNNLDISEATIVGDVQFLEDGTMTEGNAIPYGWMMGNSSLEVLAMPTNLTLIGDSAFENSALTGDLIIPNSVTAIGKSSFKNTTSLDGKVTFSEALTTIGDEAFAGCSNLTGNIYFFNLLTDIGASAFNGCSGLNGYIKLPRAITEIKESTFEGCSSLSGGLYIPVDVTAIQKNAFKNCAGFNNTLTLPANLTKICESAFEGCESMIGALTIPKMVDTLETRAFLGCKSFTKLTIASTLITYIDEKVFANCSSLTGALTIPANVLEVKDYAFYKCSKLNGVLKFHSRLAKVGNYSFYGCESFTGALTIPNLMMEIGEGAFSYCLKMTGGLTLSPYLTVLEKDVFKNSGFTSHFNLKNVTTIKENAISGTGQKASITFPNLQMEIESQESLAAQNVYFNWTESDSIPATLNNVLVALDDQFRTDAYDAEADPFMIYIPEGSTSIYESILNGYFFEELIPEDE